MTIYRYVPSCFQSKEIIKSVSKRFLHKLVINKKVSDVGFLLQGKLRRVEWTENGVKHVIREGEEELMGPDRLEKLKTWNARGRGCERPDVDEFLVVPLSRDFPVEIDPLALEKASPGLVEQLDLDEDVAGKVVRHPPMVKCREWNTFVDLKTEVKEVRGAGPPTCREGVLFQTAFGRQEESSIDLSGILATSASRQRLPLVPQLCEVLPFSKRQFEVLGRWKEWRSRFAFWGGCEEKAEEMEVGFVYTLV